MLEVSGKGASESRGHLSCPLEDDKDAAMKGRWRDEHHRQKAKLLEGPKGESGLSVRRGQYGSSTETEGHGGWEVDRGQGPGKVTQHLVCGPREVSLQCIVTVELGRGAIGTLSSVSSHIHEWQVGPQLLGF